LTWLQSRSRRLTKDTNSAARLQNKFINKVESGSGAKHGGLVKRANIKPRPLPSILAWRIIHLCRQAPIKGVKEMSWNDYDEINLGPQHEAERILQEEIQREKLDAELGEIAEGE